MLEVAQAGVHRVGGADTAQTAQGEVVVKDQRLLRVVKALDVLARLGVVGAPVDVLHHVKVIRDIFEMVVLVGVQHLVHEINVSEVPRCSRLILHFEGRLYDLLHHVGPVVVLDGRDHLVNVQQRDIIVSEM